MRDFTRNLIFLMVKKNFMKKVASKKPYLVVKNLYLHVKIVENIFWLLLEILGRYFKRLEFTDNCSNFCFYFNCFADLLHFCIIYFEMNASVRLL